MNLKPSLFIATLLLVACGGTPKEPEAPASESSAATNPEAIPAPATPKSEEPKPEAPPEPDASCDKDDDCTIFADCCHCKAVSSKMPLPPSCEGICGESKCEVKGKTLANVACVAGKCKLN